LNVKIGDDDELGSFIFRTPGFNSIRSLAARLSYYRAVSGNLLTCLPLELRLRGKSTTQGHRSAIYYVDLTVRERMTLEEAIAEARQNGIRRKAGRYEQVALDRAGSQGFSNGAFEDSEEEILEIVEEFFPAAGGSDEGDSDGSGMVAGLTRTKVSLKEKLGRKVTDPNADPV
jgi:hypothetical protein